MKVNATVFWVLAAFFAVVAAVYAAWSWTTAASQLADVAQRPGIVGMAAGPEWAGTLTLGLCSILWVLLAYYVGKSYKSQGGELAEDRLDANIDDGDPELGHFSPWSWWPIFLAASICLALMGFAVGIWITFIGVAVTGIALVGWVYEYYRGNFGH